jgi:hypothetical protein
MPNLSFGFATFSPQYLPMKTYQETAPFLPKTVFNTPASPLTKFAKVAGTLTALAGQTESTVTFGSAPTAGQSVEVFYGQDIVIPPAARTASGLGAVLPAPAIDKGLTLFLCVTAVAGSAPTLDCKVQQLDVVSGLYFDVPGASFPQVTGVVNAALTIFPGAPATANVSVNGTIRNQFRVAYTIGGAGPSFTFSIGSQAYN